MNSVNLLLVQIFLLLMVFIPKSCQISNNAITDFRYNSARIDAITRLPNDTLIVVSNGYYWVLNHKQLPRHHNVGGHISQLYPKFKKVDALFTDPYNEMDPKIYLISHSKSRGLRVVCQEFNEGFRTHNTFCHLPVDNKWISALKDIDLKKPIDAATWRNRSKDKDEGFWVFFQGKKMTVIDPYKMDLRFTYDIQQWMSINETITATYYDYRTHSFHLFFDKNKYYIWKVNVSLMNSLPMGWDRAFLHGSLSEKLKINKDFFKFSERELRNSDQPFFQNEVLDNSYDEEEEEEEEKEIAVEDKEEEPKQDISNELDRKEINNELIVFKNNLFHLSDEAVKPRPVSNTCHEIKLDLIAIFYILNLFTFYRM